MEALRLLRQAIDYMEEHLHTNIEIEEIARTAMSSNYHFQRMFHALTGFTVTEYMRNRRLTLAAEELAEAKPKVIDVALKYGYESPEAFAKAFQRMHGVTPGAKNDEGDEEYQIFSKHVINEKGDTKEIPFSEESSGTRKMFCLFDFFYDALQNGYTLFIDELNAKLHPLLVRYIVSIFHNPETNRNNAQLIFTTHDLYILTRDVFRRDEIWFTQKNPLGLSTLYSLVEYRVDDNTKVRSDASFSKDYASGRYGAIPLLKEFNLLEGT